MQRFTELRVWEQSHTLVLEVYRLTASFPSHERFGLVSQLRRAALSVPTNIAEGAKRTSRRDYSRFLNVAEGSLAETQYLLRVSRDLGYAAEERVRELISHTSVAARMLHALRLKVGRT